MPPHFAGMNALYSQDFYQIAARRLEPGGIVAQWLPLHLLPPRHSASVAATFQSVFPDSLLWIQPKTNTGILLGRLSGGGEPLGASWPGLEGRGDQRPASADLVGRSVVLHAEELRRYAAFGQIITDDNQALAYGMLRRDGKAIGPGMAKLNLKIISRAAAPGEPRPRSRRTPSPD
jgi:hypothetical protein